MRWSRKDKNGDDPEPRPIPVRLQLESGEQDGSQWGTADEPRPIGPRIFVVLKLPREVPEGDFKIDHFYSNNGEAGGIVGTMMVKADSGLDAIQTYYKRNYALADRDDKPERADGRYVALDFYGHDRTEALVVGGWKVDIDVAPQALGVPE